jgi:hypothetical protein
MMALALSLAGCGGGSSSSNNNNTGNGSATTAPGNSSLATITGMVVDTSTSHNPVAGAVVTVTGTTLTAKSDATGKFVIANVPLTATSISVAGPSTFYYYNDAIYNGQFYDLTACTLPLPKLVAGANAPFTEIEMFSAGTTPPTGTGGCPSSS